MVFLLVKRLARSVCLKQLPQNHRMKVKLQVIQKLAANICENSYIISNELKDNPINKKSMKTKIKNSTL